MKIVSSGESISSPLGNTRLMYSARDRVRYSDWLEDLDRVVDLLQLSEDARSIATDLFLADVPQTDRSKRASMAACIYAGALIAGDGRSQGDVAAAADVSRLTIQKRWKGVIDDCGFETPDW